MHTSDCRFALADSVKWDFIFIVVTDYGKLLGRTMAGLTNIPNEHKAAPNTGMKRRYFKELRYRQIRALVELDRRGCFAEVARRLQLSVPSVWQQIRALEDEFKVRLAVASGNQVELTDDGHLLAELAAPVVESFESLRLAFAERQKGLKRGLVLATTTSLLTYDLPAVIADYRKSHPEVQITFVERPSHQARAMLEQGGADLAIVGVDTLPAPRPHYHIEPVTDYFSYLVCPAGHELLKAKRLTLAQIIRHPLVLPGVDGVLHDKVSRAFAEAGLRDVIIGMTAHSLSLVNSYVSMGYGVGIVSLSTAIVSRWMESGYHDLHLRDVSKLFGKEPIVMIHRATGHEFSHVRAFRETVMTVMKQHRAVVPSGLTNKGRIPAIAPSRSSKMRFPE